MVALYEMQQSILGNPVIGEYEAMINKFVVNMYNLGYKMRGENYNENYSIRKHGVDIPYFTFPYNTTSHITFKLQDGYVEIRSSHPSYNVDVKSLNDAIDFIKNNNHY